MGSPEKTQQIIGDDPALGHAAAQGRTPPVHPGEALRMLRDGFKPRILLVQGRLERSNRVYRSGLYHRLVDASGQALTLLAPSPLDARLPQEDGFEVLVRGYLDFSLSDGRIQPILNLSEVLKSREASPDDPRLQLLERVLHKERRDVPALLRRSLLAGTKPRLLLVYGQGGVVDQDVERALGAARRFYKIEEVRVALKPRELAQALERADAGGYAAIAVVRGGGSGLEVFEHPHLIERALELRTPLISAIGHAQDTPLFERLADWRLATPSLLGTALRDLAEERQQAPLPRGELWLWRGIAAALFLLLLWRWFF